MKNLLEQDRKVNAASLQARDKDFRYVIQKLTRQLVNIRKVLRIRGTECRAMGYADAGPGDVGSKISLEHGAAGDLCGIEFPGTSDVILESVSPLLVSVGELAVEREVADGRSTPFRSSGLASKPVASQGKWAYFSDCVQQGDTEWGNDLREVWDDSIGTRDK